MSPGSVTEQLHFFAAEYPAADKVAPAAAMQARARISRSSRSRSRQALAMVEDGRIVDAKTILLLYAAKAKGLLG